MPETRGKKSTSQTNETEGDKDEYVTRTTLKDILATQERMFKSFVDSILNSITARVDGLVNTVADLKASLEFTQKDVDDLKPVFDDLYAVQQDVESIHGTLNDNNDKMEYLENQSRRNNIRIVGIPEEENETWDVTEAKVKTTLQQKLKLNSPIGIERAHRVGKPTDGTTKPRTIVCKIKDWKQKDEIVKTARKIKPSGLLIFEDLASETRRKQKEQMPRLKAAKQQGKIAYFVLDKLIIKNKTNVPSPIANPSTSRTHSPRS